MQVNDLVSALITGIVIGVLARLVVPRSGGIGCLFTVLIGIVGAAVGLAIGTSLGLGFWLTVACQVVVAGVVVAILAATRRR